MNSYNLICVVAGLTSRFNSRVDEYASGHIWRKNSLIMRQVV